MENHSPQNSASGISNSNGSFNHIIVRQLIKYGVRKAFCTGGARNAAMCFAAHAEPKLETIFSIDERFAAFMALGAAKASEQPVAIITSSGSAVANLLPALTEAYACNVPLILITCDRPAEVIDLKPMQSTKQAAICQPLVVGQLELTDPVCEVNILTKLASDMADLMQTALDKPGPVHVNLPQRGFACSTEPDEHYCEASLDKALSLETQFSPNMRVSDARSNNCEALPTFSADASIKGLIICGPDSAHFSIENILKLAESTRYPVLADACSGARLPEMPGLITLADLLVRHPAFAAQPPGLILRIGQHPVSPAIHQFLMNINAPCIRLGSKYLEADLLTPESVSWCLPTSESAQQSSLAQLQEHLPGVDAKWRERWLKAEAEFQPKLRQIVAEHLAWGELKAWQILATQNEHKLVHFSNSTPIRLANLFWPAGHYQALTARGVNGIDGTLSTFLGELLASRQRGVLVLGDQSFLHDLNALSHPLWQEVNGTICVINNEGAGIFDMIEAAKQPAYEAVMRNPTGLNIGGLCGAFGHRYLAADSEDELTLALQQVNSYEGLTVIEIKVPTNGVKLDTMMMATLLFS